MNYFPFVYRQNKHHLMITTIKNIKNMFLHIQVVHHITFIYRGVTGVEA